MTAPRANHVPKSVPHTDLSQFLTEEEWFALLHHLGSEGYTFQCWSHSTHTGDPFAYPWTGPQVYEFQITGLPKTAFFEGQSDQIRGFLDLAERLGLEVRLGEHEDRAGIRLYRRVVVEHDA